MYTKSWQIIRDDSKKTFEVCGQEDNTDHFMNAVHGMQKSGMSVSCLTPPVTTGNASRETLKVAGYRVEAGLHARLLKEYQDRARREFEQWEE